MLNKNFREFIALLEKRRVKFLIVGGYAVGVHGFPRYTADLDVFIAVSLPNAKQMLEVFREFGFTDMAISKEDFLQKDFVIEVGGEPLKIQVITGIDGVTFNQCYKGRLVVKDGDLKLPFIGLEELLKNKKASPRAKDKIDLDELRRIQRLKRQRSKNHN